MNTKKAVLVEKTAFWAPAHYASRENPLQPVEDINKAFVFHSLKHARDVKKGLRLARTFVARAVPKWLCK